MNGQQGAYSLNQAPSAQSAAQQVSFTNPQLHSQQQGGLLTSGQMYGTTIASPYPPSSYNYSSVNQSELMKWQRPSLGGTSSASLTASTASTTVATNTTHPQLSPFTNSHTQSYPAQMMNISPNLPLSASIARSNSMDPSFGPPQGGDFASILPEPIGSGEGLKLDSYGACAVDTNSNHSLMVTLPHAQGDLMSQSQADVATIASNFRSVCRTPDPIANASNVSGGGHEYSLMPGFKNVPDTTLLSAPDPNFLQQRK